MCVCVWLLNDVMAAGSWQDVAFMKGYFKDPISVYSPNDQEVVICQNSAFIQHVFSCELDGQCCSQLVVPSTFVIDDRRASEMRVL